ncbi:MAG: non-homologous end-joining DNA ligase [Chloroflexota bacterium]
MHAGAYDKGWRSEIRGDTMSVNGVTLRLSNPSKVLWPADGYTKSDLAAYYLAAAPFILPYLASRPLTMQTYPRGVEAPSIFVKRRPRGAPEWVQDACLPARMGPEVCYVVAGPGAAGAATLAWLANRDSIPLHAWLATTANPEKPDWLAFDLDPAEGASFAQVVRIAAWLHDRLDELGLRTFVKVSGSRGLHVVAPMLAEHSHDEVRSFAEAVAREAVAAMPADATLVWRLEDRKGRVFVDVRRNAYGATLVAPYSVRGRAGAPVSVALDWPELADPALTPTRWSMQAALVRLREHGDPLGPAYALRQRLPAAPRT